MANTIKHKRGTGSNPSASDLVAGEIAIRTDTGVLFTKKDDNSVVSISGGSTNLGVSTTSSAVTVTSSTGDNATISEASGSAAGVMSTAHHDKLDGIEANATADQTAAEILTAIKTVDGAGSGLDADTVDGLSSASFIRADANDNVSGHTEWQDNYEIRVGNSADLRIFHDSNDSYISQTAVGDLNVRNTVNDKDVVIQSDNGSGGLANYFRADGSTGEGQLYHYGSEKLATKSGGIDVTGNITVSGTVDGRDLATDGTKLDGIAAGAEVNVATNLSKTTTTTTNVIASSTGTNVTLNEATGSAAGLMSTTHHNKLDGIESGATADQTASEILTLIKTVDGSGSGLDADTLDGISSASFLRSDAADTMSGNLTVNARLDVGNGSGSDTEIRVYKADNNVSDHVQFYNGTTRVGEIGCQDTSWLRINQVTAKNIYTPRYIRSDGGFFVDGTSKGINGSGNFIGGTIAGASDYGTLIRSNASDNVTGHTEWQDTYQVRLGNSADMQIYHQSGVNYIDVAQDLLIRHGSETMIRCNDDSDVELYHNNSKKLETTSAGISITGNVAVSGGIDFSADGNAGGATTEVLADYERGTWTPVYRGSSTAGSYSPGTAAGVYTKVGNVVYASASVLNIGGSGGSGDLQISGFPFANDAGQASLGHVFLDDFNMTNTAIYLVAIMSSGDSHITIREVKDTAADTTMSVTDLDGSNSDIVVTLTYIAA